MSCDTNSCSHNCGSCAQKAEGTCDFLEKLHEGSAVKKVIGVVSGKGGVGKSLVTALMAVTMQRRGYRTAVLDADITGPSIPKAFGLREKAQGNEEVLFPVESAFGTQIMSVNLLLEDETDPVVWRGPVIAGAVKQFWTDVLWNDVDYMFVDMPPGTGDVPLTVFQSLPVDGIIIVTSPQELVSMIVAKAVNMAKKMNIPILGIVENMSYFTCPDCGKKLEIFGHSRIEEVAAENGLRVLARLPICPDFAKLCDNGQIENFEGDYLEGAADAAEQLMSQPIGISKRIAVSYENGQIFQHFGKSPAFRVYEVQNGEVVSAHTLETGDNGHSALAGLLSQEKIDLLICGGIGGGAKAALADRGIELICGVTGDADAAVAAYLSGTPLGNPDFVCNHHHEDGEGCGEHTCGSHGCH